MNETIYTGIDIGSRYIKIMSISFDKETNKTKVLHKNSYLSAGVSAGYISNPDIFNQNFSDILKKYQKETGIKIKEAIFTLDSSGLKSKNIKINHSTVNQNNISDVDINEIERKISVLAKKNIPGEIVETRLVKYKINNYEYYSDIDGLESKKIEAEYISIYLPTNHLSTLEKILSKNDILTIGQKVGSIITAQTSLSKEDKDLGILNIDIGADKTNISIWENNKLIFLDNILFGADDITKNISLKEKISFSKAEIFKRELKDKKIQKIVKDSYEKLATEIKKILIDLEKFELLPAGATVYGGGAKSDLIIESFKKILSMPIKKYSRNISDVNTDFQNIYAAIISQISEENKEKIFNLSKIIKPIKNIFNKLKI